MPHLMSIFGSLDSGRVGLDHSAFFVSLLQRTNHFLCAVQVLLVRNVGWEDTLLVCCWVFTWWLGRRRLGVSQPTLAITNRHELPLSID